MVAYFTIWAIMFIQDFHQDIQRQNEPSLIIKYSIKLSFGLRKWLLSAIEYKKNIAIIEPQKYKSIRNVSYPNVQGHLGSIV